MLKRTLISIFAVILLTTSCLTFFAANPTNETLVYYSNTFDNAAPYIIIDETGKIGGFKPETNHMLFQGSGYKVINPENELQKSECLEILGWNAKGLSLNGYEATKSLFSCYYTFYTDKESLVDGIKSEKDLVNYTVGVFGKDYAFYHLTEAGYSPKIYDTLDSLIGALGTDVDYIYCDELIINTYLNSKNLYSKYYQLKDKKEVPMCLYVAQGNTELLDFLNGRISELKNSNNYEMLYTQYFNNHTAHYRFRTTLITYIAIFVILVGIAITFLLLYRHIRKKYIRRIKISDECINRVAECNNSMVVFWKTDFSHTSGNPFFLNYTGLSQEDLTKEYIVETLYGKDMSVMTEDDYLSLKIERNIPCKVKSKTGLIVDVVWSNYPIHSYADGTFLVLSVGADVTAITSLKSSLFEQNMELNISEARYRFALECADIGVFEFDTATPYMPLYISTIGRNILGLSDKQNILIEDIPTLFVPEKSKSIAKFISKLSTTTEKNTAFEIETAEKYGGKHISLSFNKVIIDGQETTKVTGTIIDISKKIEKNKLIEKAAFYDPLTGIFNKEKFIIEGNTHIESMATDGKFALIRFNISHFRKIKELAGSIGAETILKEIATNVNRILFNNSVFARIENDDFAIIKDYNDLLEIDKFMSVLFKCIENLKLDVLHNENLEIYAGISLYPSNASNIIELMEYAEMSMHTAGSESDLDRYVYYSDRIKTIVEGKRSIETNLLSAITNNEFEVYYQPKVSLATNKMIGLEALIRWNHPQKGFLPPNHFIPIAEKNGNIVKIDEWVLQQACIQNKLWQTMGYKPLVVSVNVSASQFYLTDVVATIKHALETSKLDPKWLEIEITETMAHRDLDKAIEIIKRIKALGVSVSMDDFGTGYSSLSAIKVLPIDILKIDRSLIIDIVESETSKIVTNSIITLAKKLNLSLITEGIETKEQADIIREMGCDAAQGYLFYRPSKASDAEKCFERIDQ